jgi:UDP-glucuronate decarboxylase
MEVAKTIGEMTNILITGGAGFIGSSLADKLLKNDDYSIVVVDNLITGKKKFIPENKPNLRFIKADVNKYSDIAAIMISFKFDYVFHFAALVGVFRTLENPALVLEDIEGIKNVLELSKNTGVKRFFYSSSSEVYGEPVELPQNELTTPLNSKLPYAIVKNLGEAYCRSFKREYNLDYTIFRFFNTYGPKQSIDFVLSKFIMQALKNQDITVYGEGNQSRTFCYIDDNVEAVISSFENELFVNDVVNIGSDKSLKISDLAQLIIQLTNSKSKIISLPPLEEGDMTRRLPDITKMKSLICRDLIPIEIGIKKVIEERYF